MVMDELGELLGESRAIEMVRTSCAGCSSGSGRGSGCRRFSKRLILLGQLRGTGFVSLLAQTTTRERRHVLRTKRFTLLTPTGGTAL